MEDALSKAKKGIDSKGERQTLARFLDSWLEETTRPKLRPFRVKSYECYFRLHIVPALGDTTLGELTAQDVQRFLNGLTRTKLMRSAQKAGTGTTVGEEGEKPAPGVTEPGLSPRTVQYIRAIVRAVLAQAVRWGYVVRNGGHPCYTT